MAAVSGTQTIHKAADGPRSRQLRYMTGPVGSVIGAPRGKGGLRASYADGRLVVARSSQPLVECARALLGEGADPATRIVMRHVGSEVDL
jgi:hypothetical protein